MSKNKKSNFKYCSLIVTSFLCTCLLCNNVYARTMVEDAEVCALEEVYRDYHTIEDAIGNKNYLDETIGNKDYCPVYCVEENVFTFPGFMPTVNSGGHFTWTIGETVEENIISGYTVNLKGKRNCRTKIDLEKWIKDYKDIYEQIQGQVKLLNTDSKSEKYCPPDLGSRGCGMKEIQNEQGLNASGTTNWVRVTGLSNYASSLRGGLKKLNVNEFFGVLDSNRYMTVYTFVDGSLIDGNRHMGVHQDYGLILDGYSYWKEDFVKYETLCPCEWRFERSASAQEVGFSINSGVNTNENYQYDLVCGWGDSREAFLNSAKATFIGKEYISPVTIKNHSVAKDEITKCSSAIGTSTTCSDQADGSFFGVNVSTSSAQTVQTKIKCSLYGNVKLEYEEFQKPVNYSYVYLCSTGGTFTGSNISVCENSCDGHCNMVEDNTQYVTRYRVKDVKQGFLNRSVDHIRQEVCIGNTTDWPKNAQECVTTTTCPDGYHFGSDGKCNKTDTRVLRTLVERQIALIDILKNCSDWDVNYYKLDTDTYVNYEEPVYGRIEKLEKKELSESYKENHKLMAKYDTLLDDDVRYYSNSGASVPFIRCDLGSSDRECVTTHLDLSKYWISEYGKEYQKEIGYYLPEDFYRYVLLPVGKSVDFVPAGSDYLKYKRFIDIGFANYPVHYSTSHREPYYNLDIMFDKVGYQSKFSNDVYNGNYSEINNKEVDITEYNGKKLVYDCEYNVTEGEPYCPSTGCSTDEYDLGSVRIIYRPISLENPFPAMSGEGRKTGSNWCALNDDGESDCSNTNANVKKYILNNRNTEGSNVYSKDEPMYEITLNPALISKIRNYNKLTNYDDYNLYCSGEEGKEGTECRSHFVVGGMDESQLPSLEGYITGCGTDSNWYQCDNLDNYER